MEIHELVLLASVAGVVASLFPQIKEAFLALRAKKANTHVLEVEVGGETIRIDPTSAAVSSNNDQIDRAISLVEKARHAA